MLNEIWFRRHLIVAWIKYIFGMKMTDWNKFILEIS